MPVHLHSGISAKLLQQRIVLASLPVASIIAWRQGFLLLSYSPERNLPGWPDWLLGDDLRALANIQPESPLTNLLVGAIYLAPTIIGLWLTGWSLCALFARLRKRTIDPIWFITGWLLVLLAPAHASFGPMAIAYAFGLVFGALMFGGSGRYVVSPALLAAVFLQLGYPNEQTAALEKSQEMSSALVFSNPFWTTTACAFGALWLVRSTTISGRTLAGSVAAALCAAWLFEASQMAGYDYVPWHTHLLLGNAALVIAFVLTDPGCAPHTHSGRWALGISFGALLIALRVLDPAHPEASTIAALLATLLIPLIDHIHVTRVRRRLAVS